MPITTENRPAEPHCSGLQWSIQSLDELADLTALVLVGRAHHAARVLSGATLLPLPTPEAMRVQIRNELFPTSETLVYHRDGLLFEIIAWLVARQQASPNDLISEPHTKATQQGMDTIKVRFDPSTRQLTSATIYEYKCTTNPRSQFRDHVVRAFRRYYEGERDPQLTQAAIALLERFELTDEEQANVYSALVYDRPLLFQAALTVQPDVFPEALCKALFEGYEDVAPTFEDRFGDTLPLHDIRAWFADFASRIWDKINV